MRYIEHDVKQRSDEWFALRKDRITGSNFAAAAGVSPYATPARLLKDLTTAKPFTGNMHTRHGNYWEDTAVRVYNHVLGVSTSHPGFVTPAPGHQLCDTMGVSPDGVVADGDGVLLEAKCPSAKDGYEPGCPQVYMPQVQGNMAVMGLDVAHFIVFRPDFFGGRNFSFGDTDEVPVRGWHLTVHEVVAHPQYQSWLLESLEWFVHQWHTGKFLPNKTEAKKAGAPDSWKSPRTDDLLGCTVRQRVVAYAEEGISLGARSGLQDWSNHE